MLIQVNARRGGIGTSTLAFCLAWSHPNPCILLDASSHSGGIQWVSGAGEINTSWPIFFADQWNDNLMSQFDRLMYRTKHLGFFSGGALPPIGILNHWITQMENQLIIVDGKVPGLAKEAIEIEHATNSLQEWRDVETSTSAITVIQLRVNGLPKKYFTDELRLENVFFYPHQKAVRNSLELGLGIHTSSKVFKTAQTVMRHVFR